MVARSGLIFPCSSLVLRQTHINKLWLEQGGTDPGTWGLTATNVHACAVTLLEDTRQAKAGAEAHIPGGEASPTHLCGSLPFMGPGLEAAPNKQPG